MFTDDEFVFSLNSDLLLVIDNLILTRTESTMIDDSTTVSRSKYSIETQSLVDI